MKTSTLAVFSLIFFLGLSIVSSKHPCSEDNPNPHQGLTNLLCKNGYWTERHLQAALPDSLQTRDKREVPIATDLKNTPCAPNDYFKIDCNTCYCNIEKTGYLCTENVCVSKDLNATLSSSKLPSNTTTTTSSTTLKPLNLTLITTTDPSNTIGRIAKNFKEPEKILSSDKVLSNSTAV